MLPLHEAVPDPVGFLGLALPEWQDALMGMRTGRSRGYHGIWNHD